MVGNRTTRRRARIGTNRMPWITARIVSAGSVAAVSSLIARTIGYWPMNEASGQALDLVGANTMTDNNTVGQAAGIIDGARDFVAARTEYFSTASPVGIHLGTSFTWSVWYYVDINATSELIGLGEAGDLDTEFYLFGDLHWAVRKADNSAYVERTWALNATTWQHVLMDYDSVNEVIGTRVNGGARGTTAIAGGKRVGTGPLVFGAFNATDPFDGRLCDVALFSGLLTADEGDALFAAGTPTTAVRYPYPGIP